MGQSSAKNYSKKKKKISEIGDSPEKLLNEIFFFLKIVLVL